MCEVFCGFPGGNENLVSGHEPAMAILFLDAVDGDWRARPFLLRDDGALLGGVSGVR